MHELVRRGPLALPDLIKHLDDNRPTGIQVGNDESAKSRQIGVNTFMFSYFSDEYDHRVRVFYTDEQMLRRPRNMEKNFEGRYTVKVGDVCFVLIGQIVNRRLIAVHYEPSGGLVINSPTETPALIQKVIADWGQGDTELLKSSLLDDIHAPLLPDQHDYDSLITERTNSALQRLRLYFPGVYSTLQGDDLKKRRHFEHPKTAR